MKTKRAAAETDFETQEIKRRVGQNLVRLRKSRELSLEKLAQLAGVSRAMLGQVEAGDSAPTISFLWKVARGLDVRFADLLGEESSADVVVLPADSSKILRSANGGFESRALFPFDNRRRAEFYELRLRAGHEEQAEAHAEGTYENIVVSAGEIQLLVGSSEPIELKTGDSVYFRADVPHVYKNVSQTDAIMYLVMTYAEQRF